MQKIKECKIKVKDIKHVENSRFRSLTDVSDLQHDIENRGLLQPVGIRQSDNALIFGNRRVKAFENLGYEEIPAIIFDDIDDEELLVVNVVENIKRKNISAIEIGRICKILQDKNMTMLEIAKKLDIPESRVKSLILTYEHTIGTPYEKLVTLGGRQKGITPSIVHDIQVSLTQARPLTKADWHVILKAVVEGKLNTRKIVALKKVMMMNKDLTVDRCIDVLDNCKVIELSLLIDIIELNTCMQSARYENETEYLKSLIRKENKRLLF